MTADPSTGTRWQETVAQAIPGLPFPTRRDRGQRANPSSYDKHYPAVDLIHLEPSSREGLAWTTDQYLDERRSA